MYIICRWFSYAAKGKNLWTRLHISQMHVNKFSFALSSLNPKNRDRIKVVNRPRKVINLLFTAHDATANTAVSFDPSAQIYKFICSFLKKFLPDFLTDEAWEAKYIWDLLLKNVKFGLYFVLFNIA